MRKYSSQTHGVTFSQDPVNDYRIGSLIVPVNPSISIL